MQFIRNQRTRICARKGLAGSSLFVHSLEKAIGVLRAFDGGSSSLSLAELARLVGISKAAAQRFTHTLEGLGYMQKDPSSRRWSLTPRTLEIGAAYLANDPLIHQATTHLVDLNQASRETVNLSEPHATDMVFLARFTSHSRSFVHMQVGTRIPMFCTASGRAYLSTLADAEVDAILHAAPPVPYTGRTIVASDRILDLVAQARERGFATACEEFYLGDLNVAAPLLGADGRGVGAINISCPTSRWEMDDMEARLAPLLVETARRISAGPNARTRADNLTRNRRTT